MTFISGFGMPDFSGINSNIPIIGSSDVSKQTPVDPIIRLPVDTISPFTGGRILDKHSPTIDSTVGLLNDSTSRTLQQRQGFKLENIHVSGIPTNSAQLASFPGLPESKNAKFALLAGFGVIWFFLLRGKIL